MLERAMLLPFFRTVVDLQLGENLQRAEVLLQAESTRETALQLQQSLTQLVEIEHYLQLRVRWDSEQEQRQQQRLVRQRARLQWQQEMFKRVRDE